MLLCVTVIFASACTLYNKAEAVNATVIEIEKYGHAVLDIVVSDLDAAGIEYGDLVCVRFGMHEIEMPYFDGYYSNPGESMLRGFDFTDNVAVCVNYGNFAEEYGLTVGDKVEIVMLKKAAMLTVQEICKLQYTNVRADYSDDATFANFRAVTAGAIGKGKLFRSASPINNEHKRATYANILIESVTVATVLNLSDSVEDIEACFIKDDFSSAYYRTLYETGRVKALDLDVNFRSKKFAASVAEGFIFLSKMEAPYNIHCIEGKDRAGFVCMLLEALMGATLDEIIDDYMLSFYNYYGITEKEEPVKYQVILENNLFAMMYHVVGVQDANALAQADLQSAAVRYLMDAGMTQENISTLKEKLG